MTRFILLRDATTKRPISYSTLPMGDDFALLVRTFGGPERCEVRTIDCDGSRESLAAAFREADGWRPAKQNEGK